VQSYSFQTYTLPGRRTINYQFIMTIDKLSLPHFLAAYKNSIEGFCYRNDFQGSNGATLYLCSTKPKPSRGTAAPLCVDGDAAAMSLDAHRRLVVTNVLGSQGRDRRRGSLRAQGCKIVSFIVRLATAGGMF